MTNTSTTILRTERKEVMAADLFYPLEEKDIEDKPSNRLTLREFLKQDGRNIEEISHAVMFGDENAPALCDEGCEVEPDGICPHGCESILRAVGLI